MKGLVKGLLQKLRVYDYIKYSSIFHLYEKLFKPEVKHAFQKEYSFYQSFLQPCDLIFDIGANDGHKTEVFLRFAKQVVCCEPDHKNFQVLKTRFRNRRSRVRLENVAVASSESTKNMFVHHEGSAFNTLNPKFKEVIESDTKERWNEKVHYDDTIQVSTTTLSALIEKYGKPYFIKVDVEGYELEVIKGLKVPVPYLSLECLLPDFSNELKEIVSILLQLDPSALFNIAEEEELQFESFINDSQFKEFIQGYTKHHFELLVKMNA